MTTPAEAAAAYKASQGGNVPPSTTGASTSQQMAQSATPQILSSQPQIPDEMVHAMAVAAHITDDEQRAALQAIRSTQNMNNVWDPWSLPSYLETGTLWTGYQTDPKFSTHPGLPNARPAGNKVWNLTWGGRQVQITTPDFGPDVHVSINSTFGENPSQQDMERARQNPQAQRIWVEIRDKDNHPLYDQDVNTYNNSATDILMGTKQVLKGRGQPDLSLKTDPYTGAQGQVLNAPQTDQTSTVKAEIQKLYNLDGSQLWNYKNELWLSGYYPSGMKLTDLAKGSITNDDISAFASVMEAATRYWGAGKKVTWQDLLAWQAADPSAKKRADIGKPPITLADPATITKDAHDTAQQILGRWPSPQDVSTIIQLIHNRETSQQQAQIDQHGGTTTAVDAHADVDQYLREKYPNEVMAVDWGQAAGAWNQLLAQSSPQPRVVGAT